MLGRAVGCDLLAKAHPHERDAHVVFDEASHAYSVNGCIMSLSVTGLLATVERQHFDGPAVAARLAANPSRRYNAGWDAESARWLPLTAVEILRRWEDARDLGTDVHGRLERHLNGHTVEFEDGAPNADEFGQACRWLTRSGLTPYRTEWVIYDACALGGRGLAGSVDLVAVDDASGLYHIVDWKRCRHGAAEWGFSKSPAGASMLEPLAHLPECKLSHWHAQVNAYRVLLERCYGLVVAGMHMVVVQPGQPEAVVYSHPRDDSLVDLMYPC
jgi:hypothetical protein